MDVKGEDFYFSILERDDLQVVLLTSKKYYDICQDICDVANEIKDLLPKCSIINIIPFTYDERKSSLVIFSCKYIREELQKLGFIENEKLKSYLLDGYYLIDNDDEDGSVTVSHHE